MGLALNSLMKNKLLFGWFYLALMMSLVSVPPVLAAAALAPSCHGALLPSKKSISQPALLQVQEYLGATLRSLEQMRGESGLVKDTIWIQTGAAGRKSVRTLNANTSPTNIAIDLLIQTELISRQPTRASAQKNLRQVLAVLSQLQRHRESGLFFSWYGTDARLTVASYHLSSIDNLHLAIALWTIQETLPGSGFAEQATALLQKMDFSSFVDEKTGLIGGNFSYQDKNGWTRDSYNFSNLGSEARILYSAGWALGLFKKYGQHPGFVAKALSHLKAEVLATPQGNLLRTWDGSAFQLFFPKIFVSEESFSPKMADFYSAAANYMVIEGERQHLPVPAAHSPGVNRILEERQKKFAAVYNDKAGNKALVSSDNGDLQNPELSQNWDQTFAPYALFMAATTEPAKFLPLLAQIQKLQSGADRLYHPQVGWMDGLQLRGPQAGQVVPAQLAVNQGMIALSLLQMQAADGLGASGRAFRNNEDVRQKMIFFYQNLEMKMSRL